MEAAPRLQMLCFEQKVSPKAAEFGHPLKKFIANFYEEDPSNYSKAIETIEQLRISACKASKDEEGIKSLRKYYSQLKTLQNRFPMTDDGPSCVAFMWSDLYSGVVFNIADVKYELSSILYNLGALHSQLGAMEDRTTADGMKNACTHFQYAAWVFQHNRDFYPQPKGCDLSHDLLTFYSVIMLAQSQECILEKSMLDNRKSGISSKIASQIVEFYRKSINHLNSEVKSIVGSKIFQPWKRICEMKISYYGAITALHMGIIAEEQSEYGTRVAWFKLAMKKFEESVEAAEDIGIADTLAFTMDVLGGKLNNAVKENDFVYHAKVPEIESLTPVEGAVLVKGLPFDCTDEEISGPDLFPTLIPFEAHETASVYSERKAAILRDVGELIDDSNAELAKYESGLNVDKKVLQQIMTKPSMPDDIIQICASFGTRKTAVSDLQGRLFRLSKLSGDIDGLLKEANEYFSMSKPGSVTSNVVADLRAEYSKYKDIHGQSTLSNRKLLEALKLHDDNLALLQYTPDILSQKLPHVIEATAEDKAVVAKLTKLFDKVDEMKRQREKLMVDLREAMLNDDITRKIIACSEDKIDEVFDNGLAKHSQSVAVLEKNLQAQKKILEALSQANAQAAEVRLSLEQAQKPFNQAVDGMRASFKAFEDIEAQTQKGIEFFEKFYENVSKLVTRLKSVVQVEREQEERLRLRQTLSHPSTPRKDVLPSNYTVNAVLPASGIPNGQQSNQPPRLKDYLAMMNRASPRNQYTPSATPGSPGVTVPASYSSMVATSPMGNHTSTIPFSQMSQNSNTPTIHYPVSSVTPAAYAPQNTNSTTNTQPIQATSVTQTSQLQQPPVLSTTTQPTEPANQLASAYNMGALTANYNAYTAYGHLYSQVPPGANFYQSGTPVSSSCIPTNTTAHGTPPFMSAQNQMYQQQQAGSVGAQNSQNSQPKPQQAPLQTIQTGQNQQVQQPLQHQPQQYHQVPQSQYYSATPGGTYSFNSTATGPISNTPYSTENKNHSYQSSPGVLQSSHWTNPPTQGYSSVPRFPDASPRAPLNPAQQSSYTPNPMYNGNFYSYPGQTVAGNSTYVMSGQYACKTSEYNTTDQQFYTNAAVYTGTTAPTSVASVQNATVVNGGNAPVPSIAYQQHSTVNGASQTSQPPRQVLNLIDDLTFSRGSEGEQDILQPTKIKEKDDITREGTPHSDPVPEAPENETREPVEIRAHELESETPEDLSRAEGIVHQSLPKNPFEDPFVERNFRNSFDKLEDVHKNLQIESRWREYLDLQEVEARSLKISVGRICSMKNRFSDIMPYDHNRVILATSRDDYINASLIESSTLGEPNSILTQAPLPSTLEDFWTMIWERNVETLLCLSSFHELSSQFFFPSEKGTSQSFGQYQISVLSFSEQSDGLFTERLLRIGSPQGAQKNLILLHMTEWSRDPAKLVALGEKVFYYIERQKQRENPVVIQCLGGCGRSGVMSFTIRWLSHLSRGNIPNVPFILSELVRGRKLFLLEKEHLKCCYDVAYYAARKALIDHGLREDNIVQESVSVDEVRQNGKKEEPLNVEEKLLHELMDGFQMKAKITKESFEKPKGLESSSDPSDPLSQLDPLWSLKK